MWRLDCLWRQSITFPSFSPPPLDLSSFPWLHWQPILLSSRSCLPASWHSPHYAVVIYNQLDDRDRRCRCVEIFTCWGLPACFVPCAPLRAAAFALSISRWFPLVISHQVSDAHYEFIFWAMIMMMYKKIHIYVLLFLKAHPTTSKQWQTSISTTHEAYLIHPSWTCHQNEIFYFLLLNEFIFPF